MRGGGGGLRFARHTAGACRDWRARRAPEALNAPFKCWLGAGAAWGTDEFRLQRRGDVKQRRAAGRYIAALGAPPRNARASLPCSRRVVTGDNRHVALARCSAATVREDLVPTGQATRLGGSRRMPMEASLAGRCRGWGQLRCRCAQ